ncbi:MAG: hypothetical protein CSB33_02105 [Desulfobacterales bacterium]|nr:MAG: hypothetical protein CSB33_02105 [Desulfobacterales bacterium]
MKSAFLFQIRALAVNVWLEALRDKLLQLLIVSGMVVITCSLILGNMAVGGHERIIQSTGFWAMGIWGLMAVIYLGSNMLKKEIQQKTIYLVLSRPVNRPVFLIGKFAGMILVLGTVFPVLSIVWLMVLQFSGIEIHLQHLVALGFIFIEWILLAAFSLFFTTFTSPMLHNLFLVGLTFMGHWSNDLNRMAETGVKEEWIKILLKAIYYILPNLDALNFRSEAIHDLMIHGSILLNGLVIWFFWTATIFVGANLIFLQRKVV